VHIVVMLKMWLLFEKYTERLAWRRGKVCVM